MTNEECMDSILWSVKKSIGLDPNYEVYDADILIHINSILGICAEMGAGKRGFTVLDSTSQWTDFVSCVDLIPEIRPYVALRVKKAWDTMLSGTQLQVINEELKEYEWRIYTHMDLM